MCGPNSYLYPDLFILAGKHGSQLGASAFCKKFCFTLKLYEPGSMLLPAMRSRSYAFYISAIIYISVTINISFLHKYKGDLDL